MICPPSFQKEGYEFLVNVFDVICKNIRVGQSLDQVFQSTMAQAKEISAPYANILPKVLGHGIGMFLNEKLLQIKEGNQRVVEPGMIFNVRLDLKGMDNENEKRNYLLISDTVLVEKEGVQVLTREISRKTDNWSFILDDEVDEEEETKQTQPKV